MKTLLLSFAAAVLLATAATAAPLATRSDDDRWERKFDHDHDKGRKNGKHYGYGKKDKDKKDRNYGYEDRRNDSRCRNDDRDERDDRYSRDEQNRRNDPYGYGNRRREPAPVLRRFPGGILGQ
jgi:opacity protein-like surface antigen